MDDTSGKLLAHPTGFVLHVDYSIARGAACVSVSETILPTSARLTSFTRRRFLSRLRTRGRQLSDPNVKEHKGPRRQDRRRRALDRVRQRRRCGTVRGRGAARNALPIHSSPHERFSSSPSSRPYRASGTDGGAKVGAVVVACRRGRGDDAVKAPRRRVFRIPPVRMPAPLSCAHCLAM